MDETISNRMQDTVDKAKSVALINNLHDLRPPQQSSDSAANQVAIIQALQVSPRLHDLFLEIQGQVFDSKSKKVVQVSRPIMNIHGAFRLVAVCKRIAEEAEFSNYHEDDINARIYQHYAANYPYFTLWHEDYDLSPQDFNYISTLLMSFIDSSFHKAKGGKYINAVAKTYSEDLLGKVVNPTEPTKNKAHPLTKLFGLDK